MVGTTDTATPADSNVDWDVVLREYSAVLDGQRAFLAAIVEGGFPIEFVAAPDAFVAPANLASAPAEIVRDLSRLQAETDGLIQVASELLERHRPRHASRPAIGNPFVSSASSMDQRI